MSAGVSRRAFVQSAALAAAGVSAQRRLPLVDRRAAAESASRGRIADSFNTTVGLLTSAALANVKQGFFLVYINSFNEWHEGHQFEPTKNRGDLIDAERTLYHNADAGSYRLDALRGLIQNVLDG
jgi:hypothetical protein